MVGLTAFQQFSHTGSLYINELMVKKLSLCVICDVWLAFELHMINLLTFSLTHTSQFCLCGLPVGAGGQERVRIAERQHAFVRPPARH